LDPVPEDTDAAAIEKTEALTSAVAVAAVVLLTALAAQVSIDLPGTPVPQTLQTMVVLGGSAYLGSRRGLAAMSLYVLLGLFLPFYAGGDHGWDAATGASGGYLVGFVIAGYVVGSTREALGPRWFVTVPAMLMGSVALYIPGLLWLKHSVPFDWGWTIHYGLTVFILGDLLKIAGAAAILDPRAPWGKLVDRIRF
jgi:biotin transport system substrate-specific component